MDAFLTGLGIAMVIEGIAYAAMPVRMRQAMIDLLSKSTPGTLRPAALMIAALGVVLVWIARG